MSPSTELKKSLQAIFSQFGKIIDIVAAKSYKLRGQAWVVFADVASATEAMRAMQGFPFYDKPMRITYAKTKSDATAKQEGSFDPKARDPEMRAKRKAESPSAQEIKKKKAEAAAVAEKGGGAKYPDVEGAIGPNGLKRKRGGNNAGSPCARHASAQGCQFEFCSFSHTKN